MLVGLPAAPCGWLFPDLTSTCTRFARSTNVDLVEKLYYDREPMAPMCCGICPGGVANQNDLNYCCYCINCVCLYNICTKPCFGGARHHPNDV